jgi:hypothetical protein
MIAKLQAQTVQVVGAEPKNADSPWKNLYTTGALAAVLTIVFIPIQILVFISTPPPASVSGWFALFQSSWLIGLLDLDLLLVADQVLGLLVFLALYVALRRFNESAMLVGLALGLFSMVLFIASNPAFGMLTLSTQYAAAGTQAEKAILLSAGQALMLAWQGSAFQVSYLVGAISAIIISVVMLQSKLFSKACAYLGILANLIALGLYVPRIGVYISVFSVVFLWVWYILIANRLLQMGRSKAEQF